MTQLHPASLVNPIYENSIRVNEVTKSYLASSIDCPSRLKQQKIPAMNHKEEE